MHRTQYPALQSLQLESNLADVRCTRGVQRFQVLRQSIEQQMDRWSALVVCIWFMYGHGSADLVCDILQKNDIVCSLMDVKRRRTSAAWSKHVPAFPFSYFHCFGRHVRLASTLA